MPKGARFVYQRRCSGRCLYVAGWEWEPGTGCYLFVLPGGRVELSHDLKRKPAF